MKGCGLFFSMLVLIQPFWACNNGGGGAASVSAPESVELIQGDLTSPKLLSFEATDNENLVAVFSEQIVPKKIEVGEVNSTELEDVFYNNMSSSIPVRYSKEPSEYLQIVLSQKTENGHQYGIRGDVADKSGNTLTFASFFKGYNENLPKIVLSEVRTEMSKLKVEYIELYVQSSGNLGGMCLYNSYDGDSKRYEFPAIDVNQGEYTVLHMRTKESGCKDELEKNKKLSTATDSSDSRDLWINEETARLGKTDVILLECTKGGRVMDALLLSESKNVKWPKTVHEEAAKRAFNDGAWIGGYDVNAAVVSDKTTATRTISRKGNLQNVTASQKSDWFVTATSGATPGIKNTDKAYTES